MRFELDLIRASVRPVFLSRIEARRDLRLTSDSLIAEAIQKNDLAALYVNAAKTMLIVARIADQFEQEPELIDFVEGAQALIEQGRAVLDRGLTIESNETCRCGIVMMELAVRGIAGALDIPYEALLKAVHGGADIADIKPEGGPDDTGPVHPAGPEPCVADPV